MSVVDHDVEAGATRARARSGWVFALLSATSFGLAGTLATGMIRTGWTPGAAVTLRVLIAATVLAWPAVRMMRGRWALLAGARPVLVAYGLLAVAGAQLCYFYAVAHMEVGVALLIEYTAPAAVVAWMWGRHGERPSRLTVVGAVAAAVGLVLVLDLLSGADVSLAGVLWSLGAMVGATTYFLISADDTNGLPPLVLAAGGLWVGGIGLALAGLVGVLPLAASTASPVYAGVEVPWWLPVLALGLVTAAVAYVTGVEASRRLGARLASFVALSEVLLALLFAWLLLDQLPGPVQALGGVAVILGVVLVKAGERPVLRSTG